MSPFENDNVDAECELTYAKQIYSHNETETKILQWWSNILRIFDVLPNFAFTTS